MNRKPILRTFLSFSLSFLFLLCGCSLGRPGKPAAKLPDGCIESSLVYDGLTRWYRLCVPDPLPEKAPLVLYLHGGTLSMRSLFSPLSDSTSSWLRIVEEEGLILLVPNGVDPNTGDTYGNDQVWNDLRPSTAEGQSEVDDVGFLLALLDKVEAQFPIDPERVFITGASNGGMMTYRALIEAPERFSGGAAFIANLPVVEGSLPLPEQPVPIMIANGTEDPLMPFGGGRVAKDRGWVISTRETADWWIRANQAEPSPLVVRDLPDLDPGDGCTIQEEIYPPGPAGAEVRLYTLEGGGHTLPTKSPPRLFQRLVTSLLGPICRDADGVRLAWDFFSALEPPPAAAP